MPTTEMLDEFAPVKAVKSQVKLKIGIAGPSNSGKTDGALALAMRFGSVADATKKPRILLIDTENRSASLYADLYEFDTINLSAPYTPDRYKRAMIKAVELGYDWCIVDSISHEWEGEGGILRKKDKVDAANPNSNSFGNWAKVMPDHESFIEFIKQIPCHTICTMRTKQAYILEADGKTGKQKPKKVGMAPVQREGTDYEFSLVFDLDMQHEALATKNRTRLFQGEVVDLRNPVVAQELRKWLESGAAMQPQPEFKLDVKPTTTQAPTQQRLPNRAEKPHLISNLQKQQFWTVARQAGKSDEDIRIWLYERFKVQTSAEIPAESLAEALKWAETVLAARQRAPGEERARNAAKLLGVNEADLQYELSLCRGDWDGVFDALSARADEEQTALAAMKKLA